MAVAAADGMAAHGDLTTDIDGSVRSKRILHPCVLDLSEGTEHGVGVYGGYAARDVGTRDSR